MDSSTLYARQIEEVIDLTRGQMEIYVELGYPDAARATFEHLAAACGERADASLRQLASDFSIDYPKGGACRAG